MKEINHDLNHDLTFYCTHNLPQYKVNVLEYLGYITLIDLKKGRGKLKGVRTMRTILLLCINVLYSRKKDAVIKNVEFQLTLKEVTNFA